MQSELLVESLSLLLYVVAGAALTVGGLVAEFVSVQRLGAGEATVALWLAALGCVMLYAGLYGIGYGKLLEGRRSS